SLAILRSRSQGYLAGLVLMGSPYFLDMGAYQFADIPLAFFFLATLVLFFLHDRFCDRQERSLMLVGLAAALAAWTKNEGLLFLFIVLLARFTWVVRTIGRRRALRQTLWFVAGALPVLIVTVFFKLHLAPSSDIFSGQGLHQLLDRLTDGSRYGQILTAYVQTALTFTQGIVDIRQGFRFNPSVASVVLLGLYLVLMGIRTQGQDRPALLTAVTTLILMLAGYFGVYLITPHDLRWHLLTSLNRLFIQLWPAAIFLCFMIARTPESEASCLSMVLANAEDRRAGPPLSGPEPTVGTKKKVTGKQKRRRT
ncbi:MAG: phospholipid carrier-dependent glycosyltransferase, partial [Syntrophales bacterium]|nr:phospholipid carrier-dependent glycosyltransferase [Syntrophales bacterium]